MREATADRASGRSTAESSTPRIETALWRRIALDQLAIAERRLEVFETLSRTQADFDSILRAQGLRPERLRVALVERCSYWSHETARP